MGKMELKLEIREASIKDIDSIVKIIREGTIDKLDKIVYGQKGIYKYIEKRILDKNLNTIYKVAEKDNKILGVMELRILDNENIFLNYIAIKSDMRSLGIGKYMMKNLTSNDKYKYLSLDVFKDNDMAFKWYSKIGLKIQDISQWISIPRYNSSKFEELSIKKNIYSEFYYENGFDIVEVILNNRKYNVGIMGKKWFRLNQDEINKEIIEYLSYISNRHIMCIVKKIGLLN